MNTYQLVSLDIERKQAGDRIQYGAVRNNMFSLIGDYVEYYWNLSGDYGEATGAFSLSKDCYFVTVTPITNVIKEAVAEHSAIDVFAGEGGAIKSMIDSTITEYEDNGLTAEDIIYPLSFVVVCETTLHEGLGSYGDDYSYITAKVLGEVDVNNLPLVVRQLS